MKNGALAVISYESYFISSLVGLLMLSLIKDETTGELDITHAHTH